MAMTSGQLLAMAAVLALSHVAGVSGNPETFNTSSYDT